MNYWIQQESFFCMVFIVVRAGVVVKALRYKPAGRGFDSRLCHLNFYWHNPSGRTMALGSTQPLIEMSTRLFPGVKDGRCVRLKTLPLSCAIVMKFGNLNFLEPSGPLQACNGTALYLCIVVKGNSHALLSLRSQNMWTTGGQQKFHARCNVPFTTRKPILR
jgi:hypothetical protein